MTQAAGDDLTATDMKELYNSGHQDGFADGRSNRRRVRPNLFSTDINRNQYKTGYEAGFAAGQQSRKTTLTN